MRKLLLLLLTLTLMSCVPQDENPKLILISFDGFRADYLEKTDTPNFDRLVENGVRSEGLIPVFPTKTFPNHYAIVTGLYPENNGLVGNNMYDPEMNASYAIGDREAVEDPDWYEGEPIWNTAEKQGMRSGTMFWVGSDAPVQDMRPTHWKLYDGSMPDSARIDTVVKWMTLNNETEIDLATLYFSFVDSQGHRYGPDSPEVVSAIQRADRLMGYLLNRLEEVAELGNTNIIVVSDHGMQEVSRERIVVLDELIDPDKVEIIAYSPAVMMNVKTGENADAVYDALKENEEHYRVYKREDIPDRFHLKDHRRTPGLLMIAEPGFTINTRAYFEDRKDYPSGGAHGYDNQEKVMHALFIANGPDIAEGKVIGPIENVHIYELMTHLLDLVPAPNDGSPDSISVILD
ncbi:ectonucleotide pyrophosphatase/phosphodiesterase [Balneola sp. MJW-20]|uniref:alkaline phosphatase family protein n=1 Tax=Gracilimonas aurantiaca TaxID=3234185 RepID=UPI00346705A5